MNELKDQCFSSFYSQLFCLPGLTINTRIKSSCFYIYSVQVVVVLTLIGLHRAV